MAVSGQNAALKAEADLKAKGAATEQGAWQPEHPARGVSRILDAEAGSFDLLMPDGVTPRKKIALVGFASSTKGMAPFDDPEWAIVGMNQLSRHIPRGDAWFEIHKDYLDACVPGTDHDAWLRDCGLPILMTSRLPHLPTSCAYPIDRLIAKFGLDYFTSTVAYMFAWVVDYIDQRVEAQLKASPGNGLASALDVVQLARSFYREWTFGVFGIDLIVGEEYCVAPDTEVLTADLRWVPAHTLQVGDGLMGFDEQAQPGTGGRNWRRAVVQATSRPVRPCYRIRLADGTSLVSSAEHRWLTASGTFYRYRRTDELVTPAHRQPTKLVRLLDSWGEPVHSWDAGYLAAAFDGEGHLCGNQTRLGAMGMLGFGQKSNAMADTVEQALQTYGFAYRRKDTGPVNQYTIQGGRTEVLRFLGQMRPQRLLSKFNPERLGRVHAKALVPVESVEYIGEQETIGLGTSTGTFVAEGFASHNSYQKPCAEFWLGQALARDITVIIPPQSALLKQRYRYGYQMAPSDLINDADLAKRINQLTGEHQKHSETVVQLVGALKELETMRELYRLRERGGTINL